MTILTDIQSWIRHWDLHLDACIFPTFDFMKSKTFNQSMVHARVFTWGLGKCWLSLATLTLNCMLDFFSITFYLWQYLLIYFKIIRRSESLIICSVASITNFAGLKISKNILISYLNNLTIFNEGVTEVCLFIRRVFSNNNVIQSKRLQ